MFSSKKNIKNTDYFKHLVSIAFRDGYLDDNEVGLLCKFGSKLGLGTSIISDLIQNYKPYEIIALPKDPNEKFDQLFDLICIMLADDEIEEEEIDFCVNIASKMGFHENVVGALVRRVSMGIEEGHDKETIRKEATAFLNY